MSLKKDTKPELPATPDEELKPIVNAKVVYGTKRGGFVDPNGFPCTQDGEPLDEED
jgi:hypothetical protein